MVSMAGGRWDVACRPAQLLRGAGASPHVDIVQQASGGSKTGIRRTEIGGFIYFLRRPETAPIRRSGGGGVRYVSLSCKGVLADRATVAIATATAYLQGR